MVVQLYVVVCDDGSRYVIVCDDVTWSSVRCQPVSQLVYLRHVRYITQHHLGETSSLGESIRPDEGGWTRESLRNYRSSSRLPRSRRDARREACAACGSSEEVSTYHTPHGTRRGGHASPCCIHITLRLWSNADLQ